MVVRRAIWTADGSSRAEELDIPSMTEARGELIKNSFKEEVWLRMV